jgi:hypothetical protein
MAVIPAEAGIQLPYYSRNISWIPAYAGMTSKMLL